MKEIIDIAANYASGKTREVMDKVIAQAYADGYRDGYRDREDEIPVDFRNIKTDFIDLGLPSGTLWSIDFEKENDEKLKYLHYDKAKQLNIPTKKQWDELFSTCKCEYTIFNDFNLGYACFTGPNGNVLTIRATGKIDAYNIIKKDESFFWLKEEIEGNMKKSVRIYNLGKIYSPNTKLGHTEVFDSFSGYKLPIRLVQTK